MKPTLIFDFDGTLADTIELALKIYNELAPGLGSLPISKDEFPELRKLSYREIIRMKRLNWRRLPKLLAVVPKRMKASVNEVKAYPGIVELVQKLLDEGYEVGVLSSNQMEFLMAFFSANNFPEFSFVVSEKSLFGKDKALKKIIKRRGLSNKDVIYVGDEPRDVTACRRIGVPVIGVTWGLAGRTGLEREEPDRYADNANQLEELIKTYPW